MSSFRSPRPRVSIAGAAARSTGELFACEARPWGATGKQALSAQTKMSAHVGAVARVRLSTLLEAPFPG